MVMYSMAVSELGYDSLSVGPFLFIFKYKWI